MYVQSPLEADSQLSKACKPPVGAFHDPAMFTQFLAALDTSPCNAAEDPSFLYMCSAASVVIAFVCMKFVGPPARAALQTFDSRNCIHAALEQHGIMSVSTTDKHSQRNAPSIHNEMTFGA